jgi:hypothetical protein
MGKQGKSGLRGKTRWTLLKANPTNLVLSGRERVLSGEDLSLRL